MSVANQGHGFGKRQYSSFFFGVKICFDPGIQQEEPLGCFSYLHGIPHGLRLGDGEAFEKRRHNICTNVQKNYKY
jgi:hypothetical protein